jgi:putative IMPACT (imprinted ancient) family translation regulator
MCLREAEKVPLVDTVAATVTCAFGDLALLRARLEAIPGAKVSVQSFTDTGAELAVLVPDAATDAMAAMVADLTSGRAAVKFGE